MIASHNTYGYYEAIITSSNELQNFLNQIDDLTFAQVDEYSLITIGGRKIFKDKNSPKSKVINLEDIAALLQSDINNENGSLFSLDEEYNYPSLAKALDSAKPILKKLKLDGQPVISDKDIELAKQELSRKNNKEYFNLIAKLKKFWESKELVKKAFNQGELAAELQKELKDFKEKEYPKSQENIKKHKDKIEKEKELVASNSTLSPETISSQFIDLDKRQQEYEKDWGKYLKAKEEEIISNKKKPIYDLLEAERTKGFMFARYEGNLRGKKVGLQGTEVGMTLFYTDLLMKIWNFNFQRATLDTGIEGFKPTTRIPVSSIYKSEMEKYWDGRLWLEVDSDSYEIANEGRNIIFAPNVTRIQGAVSEGPQSDEESNPRPNTAVFLNWWNNYYGEVARHEPQYERLNQIMKWSLLINKLNQLQQTNPLSFLEKVEVTRTNWFPNWIQKQGKKLAFTKWDKIKFFPEGYNYQGLKTEKLEFLDSENYGESYSSFYGGVSLASKKNFDGRIPLPNNNSSVSKLSRRSNIDYSSVKIKAGKIDEFTNLAGTEHKFIYRNKNVSEIVITPKIGTKFRTHNSELKSENLKLIPKFESTPNNGLKLTTRLEDAKGVSTEFGEVNITKTKNGFGVGFQSRDIDAAYSSFSDLSKHKGDIPTFLASKDDVVSFRYSQSHKDFYVKQSNSNKWLKFSEGSGGGNDLPPSQPTMTVAEPAKDGRILNGEFVDEAQVPGYAQGFQEFPGKGAGSPKEFTPRQKAQQLAENPLAFIESRKVDLQLRKQNIDSALKDQNYAKAEKLVNESITQHGKDPELMLRKASIEQQLGRVKIEIITQKGATPIKKNDFFDAIKSRNFKRIETDTEFLYVQDSPSLNNLEPTQLIEQSLSSGSGIKRYKLQPGKIGEVPISHSGFGDVSVSSHPSTEFKGNNIANSLKNRPQNSDSNNDCENQQVKVENQNPNCSPEKSEKPVSVLIKS